MLLSRGCRRPCRDELGLPGELQCVLRASVHIATLHAGSAACLICAQSGSLHGMWPIIGAWWCAQVPMPLRLAMFARVPVLVSARQHGASGRPAEPFARLYLAA